MKRYFLLLLICLSTLSLSSCYDDNDDVVQPASNLDVNNFVYRGMKLFYLYKDKDPVLNNNHFANQADLNAYLSTFNSPEDLFNSLRYVKDRFSFIMPNFRKLEKLLSGITLNNGMEFGLVNISGTQTVFGYVRYVLPNTSAESQGVKRGMLFDRIDGTALSISNYQHLLQSTSYTIGLAKIQNHTLASTNQSIALTKTEYHEDPVFKHKVIDTAGHKIGYLMYNGFTRSYDDELNAAFGDFKAAGVTDLVVDLRYNGGGDVESSKDLASMITGQFNGKLFATAVYNDNFDTKKLLFDQKIPTGATINSLGLSKVYVLTTRSTASASELLINGLNPYINVVQIGDTTIGKFQASITVYDSPDFTRSSVKPGHTYAMQPLVLKTINADGFTGFFNGLFPDIEQQENFAHLGVLGNPNELLLHTAIQHILSGGNTVNSFIKKQRNNRYKLVGDSKMNLPTYQRMYTEIK